MSGSRVATSSSTATAHARDASAPRRNACVTGIPAWWSATPSVSGPAICTFTRGGGCSIALVTSRNVSRPACASTSNTGCGADAATVPSTVIEPSGATRTSGSARAHCATMPSSGERVGSCGAAGNRGW